MTSAMIIEKNDGQVVSSHRQFFGDPLHAVLVHPLKIPASMLALHEQVTKNLRPPLPPLWLGPDNNEGRHPLFLRQYLLPKTKEAMSKWTAAEKQAVRFYERACVNNPLLQLSLTGVAIKECEPPPPYSTGAVSSLESITVAALGSAVAERFQKAVPSLRIAAIMHVTDPLADVRRSTMHSLFSSALSHSSIKVLLVLEPTAAPTRAFESRLLALLNDGRCGGHLLSEAGGGTLQLGAEVSGTDAWAEVNQDLKAAGTWWGKAAQCFNGSDKATRAFGVLYHRNTFQEIVDWLSEAREEEGEEDEWEYNGVFARLAEKGYIGRIAYPFLLESE